MAVSGHIALATLLSALSGGLDRPPSNWNQIDIRQPAATQPNRTLNEQGYLVDIASPSTRKKISPADYFRIVEIAPKAIDSPDALKQPPAGNSLLLHIRTGDGKDFYFAADGDRFRNPDAQQISDILHHYQ
ncbi:MAG TPA: hypothetical protein VFF26_14310 [Gallionella sp.]|nr:hypothetical protein [Gallionella sp.]